jgi:hypothetical protein
MSIQRHKIQAVVEVDSDFLFDQYSSNFLADLRYNRFFVTMQSQYFNEVLRKRGFVTLNEVLQQFELRPTAGGVVIGWIRGSTVEFKEISTHYQGVALTGILLRHNATDNVLKYLEKK